MAECGWEGWAMGSDERKDFSEFDRWLGPPQASIPTAKPVVLDGGDDVKPPLAYERSGFSRRTYGLFISGLGALVGLIGFFVLPFVTVLFFSLTAYQLLTFDQSPLAALRSE